MSRIESSIKVMYDLKAIPVYYDMGDRYGNDADGDGRIEYDCSSAVSKALGISMNNNTETLKTALPGINYKLIHDAVDGSFNPKRGDVVIWGPRNGGSSLGAFGHVVIMLDGKTDGTAQMIHCNFGSDGVTVDNYNQIWEINGRPREMVYREQTSTNKPSENVKPTPPPAKPSPAPASKNKVYRVDELKKVHNIWQVRCNDLVPVEFNWTDNGIACEDITITDSKGNVLPEAQQVTNQGSYFIIPESKISSIGSGAYGSGNYYWIPVQFKHGGRVWLSAWDRKHLLKG
ncbi:lytic exoenzyme target recognition domain-containing protein [Enterococcus sp. LJL128]